MIYNKKTKTLATKYQHKNSTIDPHMKIKHAMVNMHVDNAFEEHRSPWF
jgi:hypothetical protein